MSHRVWLVRHASTDWTGIRWCGTTDLGLSNRGRVEAERLAVSVSGRIAPGADLVSSPLRRALETADRLADATGSIARIDGRLREVDFGDAEGLDWSELEARHPDLAAAVAAGERSIDWPGGESAGQVRARAARVWREVASGPDEVVIVSHGGFIRALLGVAVTAALARPPLGPASVVELRRKASGWVVA
jgi:broad specificity phosphatase PhoE